ncbi:MAG: FecR domain-containing protein [Pedobacter sp.]|uniref:FecR family protein n=1 Tax=Pedobacter sp. TaxID=1411316 RepID=UPI0035636445
MNKEEAKGLAKKFLDGTATVEERENLHNWNGFVIDDAAEVVYTAKQEDADTVKNRLFNSIKTKIDVNHKIVRKNRMARLWYRLSAAAAILLVSGLSIFFYTTGTIPLFKNHHADAKNIAVGKNSAVLTMANGKQIDLSLALDGKLAEEAGISISKTSDGQLVYQVIGKTGTSGGDSHLNTISTPKAGQYQVVLTDGTKVWLNAASSISFPTVFENLNQRKVQLKGEAYFEVAKDKSHPFIVQTDRQNVKVLGTHFNISDYDDDLKTKTTLLEGKVRVAQQAYDKVSFKSNEFVVLNPGQQAILAGGAIEVTKVDTEEAVAWKNGYFKFKSETLSEIMIKLSRWYDVDIVYEGEISKDRFGGTISRYKNIADVLEMLESTKLVQFKVEGRKIIVR